MKSRLQTQRKKQQTILSQSKQTSLANKIIEEELRQNNDQYQYLLIKAKQLELELLDEENLYKQMMKEFNKKKGGVDAVKGQYQKVKMDCQKKRIYLQDYYTYLDKKLKSSGPTSINMFAALDQYSKGLKDKEEKEKFQMENGMIDIRNQTSILTEQLAILEETKDKLVEEYEEIKQQKENQRKILQEKNQQKKIQFQKKRQEYNQIINSIQGFRQEKTSLQQQEQILKKILNIEEEHKRHWMMIENAIKKQFTAQLKAQRYKQSVSMEYKIKTPQLVSLVNQRKYQKQIMEEQVEERKKHLEQVKVNMNQSLIKYSQLEGEMMRSSNKRPSR